MWNYGVNETRLKDVYPLAGITHKGIFSYLFDTQPEIAWLTDNNTALKLDRVFHGKYGNRLISPFLESFLLDGEITELEKQQISRDIYDLFAFNWGRKYALLSLQYNPISNYDMTETENTATQSSGTVNSSVTTDSTVMNTQTATGTVRTTDTDTGERTVEKTYAGTETETLTKGGQETHETKYEGIATHATEYSGQRQTMLAKAGAERTIEHWPTGEQTTRTTESGGETENRSVFGFNSTEAQDANRIERNFTGRETSTVQTLPEHQTQTAFQDRTDTETERFTDRTDTTRDSFNGRTDTLTDSYTNRTDSTERAFNNRADTETERFSNRQHESILDDSGHTSRESTDTDATDTTEGTSTNSGTVARTLTRSGNIGVTTSQQMAQSEIDLWKWNFYTDTVFRDVQSILVSGVY